MDDGALKGDGAGGLRCSGTGQPLSPLLAAFVHSHSLSPSLSKTRGSRPDPSAHLVGVVRLAEKMDHRCPRAGVSSLSDAF